MKPDIRDWDEWKSANASKLCHPADFERKFVDLILSKVPGLNPNDVTAQYEFIDDTGKRRLIDFAIINPDKGYSLMIELDGASKDTNPSEWMEFLERQNSIVLRYKSILRFSNKIMFEQPDKVINTILRGLNLPPIGHGNELGSGITNVYIGRRYIGKGQCCADCGSLLGDYWRNPEGNILFRCALCG